MPDDLEDQSRRGLLGRSLAGSRAPEFHAHIDAAPYDLLEAADDVEARRLLLAPNHAALNVSPVYRGLARELCAHLSPRARAIGAVDTVLRESDGTLCGEHASSAALEFVLRRAGIRTAGRRVLIVTDPACASDESAPLLVPDLVAPTPDAFRDAAGVFSSLVELRDRWEAALAGTPLPGDSA